MSSHNPIIQKTPTQGLHP